MNDVTARVARAGKTYFAMAQRVIRKGEVLCSADVKVACVTRDTLRPAAIPLDVRQAAVSALESEENRSRA